MRLRRIGVLVLAVATAAGVLALGSPASAQQDEIHVRPGQSIQAAVNRADPGTTIVVHPGVYREYVVIRKDRITIRGSGASGRGTVLTPPATPPNSICGPSGICILAKRFNERTGEVIEPVNGIRVSGIFARGYEAFGILTFGVNDLEISHSETAKNGEYGFASFTSTNGRYLYNESYDDGEAGFYVGDSPETNFRLTGNIASGSLFGIFIRDASFGAVADNRLTGNCSGIAFINTPGGPDVRGWTARRNQSYANNKACEGEHGMPPFSGNGLLLAGASEMLVQQNTVWANRPSTRSPFSGGIVMTSLGPERPNDNLIQNNIAYRNRPADLIWDGTGVDNLFRDNHCDTSRPAGLCAGPHPGEIHVTQGQSIQAAVNRANPGDTIIVHPGVYREHVLIRKDGLRLRGAGASSAGTVLKPGGRPGFCGPSGICMLAKRLDPQTFEVLEPVAGVRVTGFLVQGFRDSGIITFGANRIRVTHNRAVDNEEYGITSFVSSGNRFLYNVAMGARESGFYIGDSPRANFTMRGNRAERNALGVLVRDASHGRVAHNAFKANCSGVFFINTPSPAPTRDWVALSNESYENSRLCPPHEAPFAISGNGIFLGGADQVTVRRNIVWANRPSGSSPVPGGIVVASAGPGGAPNGNLVEDNIAYRNRPADIVYDGSGTRNRFVENKCGTSRPGGLCP